MTWLLAIILAAGLAYAVALARARRRSFAPYVHRRYAGRDWRRAFPDAGKAERREFLLLFADAFSLSLNQVMKLRPDDAVIDVYHALNPPGWRLSSDNCELESLGTRVKKRYGLDLLPLWRGDLTLGEVFAVATAAAAAARERSKTKA